MIEVTSISVRSFDLDHLDVFWDILATEEDISHYQFYVLRSQDGPAGPFNVIAGPFFNTYMLRDPNVHMIHNWRTYYYMLRAVNIKTQETKEFGPQYHAAPPDLVALEIQRRQQLLYKEKAGRPAILFPRLTAGQHCVHCWDRGTKGNSIGRAKQQNCETCYDTTYVGGYASPIQIYIQIDPSTTTVQKTDEGDRQFEETSARLSAFPPVKPLDMIVEAENKRWYVNSRTPTEKLRATLRQELKVRRYLAGDIRYKVPINVDMLSSPEREFINAHDVDVRKPISSAPIPDGSIGNL